MGRVRCRLRWLTGRRSSNGFFEGCGLVWVVAFVPGATRLDVRTWRTFRASGGWRETATSSSDREGKLCRSVSRRESPSSRGSTNGSSGAALRDLRLHQLCATALHHATGVTRKRGTLPGGAGGWRETTRSEQKRARHPAARGGWRETTHSEQKRATLTDRRTLTSPSAGRPGVRSADGRANAAASRGGQPSSMPFCDPYANAATRSARAPRPTAGEPPPRVPNPAACETCRRRSAPRGSRPGRPRRR